MFQKYAGAPIFGDKTTGTLFDVYLTNLPDGRLRMDLSTRRNGSLSVSFSEDGVNWSAPVTTLPPEPASGWEEIVNRNCVVKVGDTYRMWYTGQAHGNSYIGFAESEDGVRFRRVSDRPVLSPEAPFEGESVMNPCVLFENGLYRMWYSAGETYEPNVLCYAESEDGIRWRKSPLNPVLEKNPAKAYEQNRIGGCQMLRHRSLGYLLFYIGYRDINTACICAACSEDGVTNFRRCLLNPIVQPTPGAWDADSCYKPSALFDENRGVWRVWYNGRRGSEEYVGLAEKPGDFTAADFEPQ